MPFHDQDIRPTRLRILGVLGMAGAPWMLIDFIENGLYDRFKNTSASGVHNLLFITGCLCSIAGFYYIKAAGTGKWGRVVLIVQFVLLAIANIWNIVEIMNPDLPFGWFRALGFSWPVSCLFLIVTGLVVIKARRLKGWRRFAPLLAGFWFPVMYLVTTLVGNTLTGLLIAGSYAAITFAAMGFVLVTLPPERFQKPGIKQWPY